MQANQNSLIAVIIAIIGAGSWLTTFLGKRSDNTTKALGTMAENADKTADRYEKLQEQYTELLHKFAKMEAQDEIHTQQLATMQKQLDESEQQRIVTQHYLRELISQVKALGAQPLHTEEEIK